MSNILITGGTGFIGSYIAKELLDEGNDVVCFDSSIDYERSNFIGE